MTSAIVLFAHGARDPRWADPFNAVAERLRSAAPERPVELAFLELMQPDFPTCVRGLAAEGVRRIDVVPLFLGTGGHLRDDLPRCIDNARKAHVGLDIRLHQAIGEDAGVVEAMAAAALALARFGE